MYSIYNTTFRDTARIYEWVLLKQLWLSFISFLLTSHGENGVCSNFSDVLYSYLLDYIVDNIPEKVFSISFYQLSYRGSSGSVGKDLGWEGRARQDFYLDSSKC